MAKQGKVERAGKARNAEALWRRDQKKLDAVNRDNQRSEFQHTRYAGAGMLGRALDSMSSVRVCHAKVRFEPPKPRDGRGKPIFGSGRG